MYTLKIVSLGFLLGQAAAFLATFDTSGINLNNYGGATFTNFSIVTDSYSGTNQIVAKTPPKYVQAGAGAGTVASPKYGIMQLNTHSSWGHLSNFWFGCYTPEEFVYSSFSCNISMIATCYALNNNLYQFDLIDEYYTQSNNAMKYLDLTGFYQNYATEGYFPGNGSTAACISYRFDATPYNATAPGQGLPVGLFMDSMSFTTTTAS